MEGRMTEGDALAPESDVVKRQFITSEPRIVKRCMSPENHVAEPCLFALKHRRLERGGVTIERPTLERRLAPECRSLKRCFEGCKGCLVEPGVWAVESGAEEVCALACKRRFSERSELSSEHRVAEVRVLELNSGEIEVVPRPAHFCCWLQARSNDTYDGLTHFAIVLTNLLVHNRFPPRLEDSGFRRSMGCHNLGVVACPPMWLVWQSQIPTENIDALLTPAERHRLVRRGRYRVHPCDPHSRIRIAQLVGCGTEALDESALLEITLTAVRHDQSDSASDSSYGGESRSENIDFGGWATPFGMQHTSDDRVSGQYQDKTDDDRSSDRDPERPRSRTAYCPTDYSERPHHQYHARDANGRDQQRQSDSARCAPARCQRVPDPSRGCCRSWRADREPARQAGVSAPECGVRHDSLDRQLANFGQPLARGQVGHGHIQAVHRGFGFRNPRAERPPLAAPVNGVL